MFSKECYLWNHANYCRPLNRRFSNYLLMIIRSYFYWTTELFIVNWKFSLKTHNMHELWRRYSCGLFIFDRELVSILLQNGASPNLADESGCTALHMAAWSGNEKICHIIMENSQVPVELNARVSHPPHQVTVLELTLGEIKCIFASPTWSCITINIGSEEVSLDFYRARHSHHYNF